MRFKLLTLTPDEKLAAQRIHMDPLADQIVEERANQTLRVNITSMAFALEKAVEHPEDEDCARLLKVMEKIARWSIDSNNSHVEKSLTADPSQN